VTPIPFLYSVPRSGTGPVHTVLNSYFKETADKTFHHKPAHEHFPFLKDIAAPNYLEKCKYVLRFHPMHLNRRHMLALAAKTDLIFLERKNIYDGFLSHLISLRTGLYYLPGGLPKFNKSLVIERKQFEIAEAEVFFYEFYKKMLRPKKVLFFEDLLQHGAAKFLRMNGFKKPFCSNNLILTEKQNRYNKRKAFANLKELNGWYRDSFLNSLHPVDPMG
jgi:hypothetical protein